jgi:dolichol-phosphate mannosyltransferase
MSQFLLVGATGLAAHMSVLSLASLSALPFWAAQTCAILAAMSWNFVLNNSLTFRDRRLSGPALWRGLLSFYAACLGGALASEAAGAGLAAAGAPWLVAGVAGAVLGAFWNYQAARRLTWRASSSDVKPAEPLAAKPVALSLSGE